MRCHGLCALFALIVCSGQFSAGPAAQTSSQEASAGSPPQAADLRTPVTSADNPPDSPLSAPHVISKGEWIATKAQLDVTPIASSVPGALVIVTYRDHEFLVLVGCLDSRSENNLDGVRKFGDSVSKLAKERIDFHAKAAGIDRSQYRIVERLETPNATLKDQK